MRKIYLHGVLQKYGSCIELAVETAGEAVGALCTNFPKMLEDIRQGSWLLLRGDAETGMCLDEEAIAGMGLGSADLHIMPEVMGSKRDGLIKAIAGVALIAVSFGSGAFLANPLASAISGGAKWTNSVGQIGVAMALSGVSTMLTPEELSKDEEKSFTATGPVATQGQGQAVQIIYGEVITGGIMISGGIDAHGLEITEDKGGSGSGSSLSTVEADADNDSSNDTYNRVGLNG